MNQPTPQKNKDIQETPSSESFRMKFLAHAQTFDRGGHDAGPGNRAEDTLVGGERSHHCTNPATPKFNRWNTRPIYNYLSFKHFSVNHCISLEYSSYLVLHFLLRGL